MPFLYVLVLHPCPKVWTPKVLYHTFGKIQPLFATKLLFFDKFAAI